jgi:hypothetical protein
MNSFFKLRVPEGHKERTGFCSVIKSRLKKLYLQFRGEAE